MIATAKPPQPHRPRAARALATALGAILVIGLAGPGCSKTRKSNNASDDQAAGLAKGDPWKVAAARLKRETDFATCKSALRGLRADTGSEEGKKLPALTDADLAALTAVVPLSAADVEEIRGGPFSEHDAAYLAECFYLRDAARSLGLAGLPPERQAELAFAWVCRQVYLQPWVQRIGPQTFFSTALPPTAVLRRGFGSGLERMYVFLALLQQLELDACLIGGPTAGPSTAAFNAPGRADKPEDLAAVAARAPRGPFWAVGVRVGADVRLFDPWRGQPWPVTLAQLKANPAAAKAWFEDKANPSGATPEAAARATVYLAVPVNALSARMAAFDSHLKGELAVKTSLDAKALRAAFPDPKPTFWNPPEDPLAYGRCARSFLPAELGGTAGADSGPRLYDLFMLEQVPAEALRTPDSVEGSLAARLRRSAANVLALSFVEPPNPRERIERGQFQEAARDLVTKQELFASGLERLRLNKDADKQIGEWIEEAKELYQAVGRAQSLTRDKDAAAAALQAVEIHWRAAGAQLLIDRAAAEVGQAEAAFLLALCKHEQAERVQLRLERASGSEAAQLKPDVIEAWRTALSAWRTYEQNAAAHAGFPGRAAHAKALAARAARFVEADAKK